MVLNLNMDSPCHQCTFGSSLVFDWGQREMGPVLWWSCDVPGMHLTAVSTIPCSPLQRTSDTEDSDFVALKNNRLSLWVLQEQVVYSELIDTVEASTKKMKIFPCNFRPLPCNEDLYHNNIKLSLISLIQCCNLRLCTTARMVKHILQEGSYSGSLQITAAELRFLFVVLKNLDWRYLFTFTSTFLSCSWIVKWM